MAIPPCNSFCLLEYLKANRAGPSGDWSRRRGLGDWGGNSTEEHSTNVSADEINNPSCSSPRLSSLLPLHPTSAHSSRKGNNPFSPGHSGCLSSLEWLGALIKCGKWGIFQVVVYLANHLPAILSTLHTPEEPCSWDRCAGREWTG